IAFGRVEPLHSAGSHFLSLSCLVLMRIHHDKPMLSGVSKGRFAIAVQDHRRAVRIAQDKNREPGGKSRNLWKLLLIQLRRLSRVERAKKGDRTGGECRV
ncbi:MAG: hypothetical protein P4M05_10050, partial [Bradyrhizobium sp.]|nr:hypothetical protein [Bradyrhizobium sp.]